MSPSLTFPRAFLVKTAHRRSYGTYVVHTARWVQGLSVYSLSADQRSPSSPSAAATASAAVLLRVEQMFLLQPPGVERPAAHIGKEREERMKEDSGALALHCAE